MLFRAHMAWLVALAEISCGEPPRPAPPPRPPPPVEPPPEPPPPRADGRLPETARPTKYEIALDVDPNKARFRGVETIKVQILEATFHLVLHARDARIDRAAARAGGDTVVGKTAIRMAHGGHVADELVVTFARALPKGEAELDLSWEAPFAEDLAGLYRVKEGNAWYAYTQFEATDARRMFPCFDEPGFKVPFELKVTAPNGTIAVANAPEISKAPSPEKGREATTFTFGTTRPLPTYLVAIAVGDFDVKEGTKEPVAIRIIAPKGKGDLGGVALDTTAAITQKLADYFGVPHPFPKLDIVAVPDFAAGAMENPGLVTFRQELLLLDRERASTGARRALALVVAHEMAHQWFGNLVTAEWWNDVWLNEAMATWMEARTVDAWQPTFGQRLAAARDAQEVMNLDALVSARAVRQPVTSTSEATEAFDRLTYEKGAAVLTMLERWIGPEPFRTGVREYLKANAFKNAKAETLLTALDKASGKDVTQAASTFLDRAGVPLVSAHLACEPKGRWNVTLQQEPWRPLGSTAPETDPGQNGWTTPVCVQIEGRRDPVCTVMTVGVPSMVAGTGACPAWTHPNAGSGGYYRFALAAPELTALARAYDKLDAPNRLSVVTNSWAMVRAGALPPEHLLKVLPLFDKENERVVVEQITTTLDQLNDTLIEDGMRPDFRAYVVARLARHKKTLGWTPKTKEEEDKTLLRETVLFALGDLAQDATTLGEAEPFAQSWLKDPASIDENVAQIAVPLASRRAGEARLDELRQALKRAKTPEQRTIALRAIYGFDDPQVLEKALDLFLTDELRAADVHYLLAITGARRAARPVVFRWVKDHWDKLRAKLPHSLGAPLMSVPSHVCTRAERDEAEAFFKPRAKDIEGAERPLAEALEAAALCAELRTHGTPAIAKALVKK
jgi:aminopeptidase N